MVILHLFIDYHYKSIVSIIRKRHVLTLHLSTANCRRKLTTGCCCKNTAALYCTCYAIYFYQIESYHSSLSCGPLSMHFNGTLILLYFIEMLPCTVSLITSTSIIDLPPGSTVLTTSTLVIDHLCLERWLPLHQSLICPPPQDQQCWSPPCWLLVVDCLRVDCRSTPLQISTF